MLQLFSEEYSVKQSNFILIVHLTQALKWSYI